MWSLRVKRTIFWLVLAGFSVLYWWAIGPQMDTFKLRQAAVILYLFCMMALVLLAGKLIFQMGSSEPRSSSRHPS